MKTFTEVAKELNMTKGPLSQRMNKINHFRDKYCKRKGNQLLISKTGIQLIDYPKHNSTSHNFHTRKGSYNSNKITSEKKSEIINQLLDFNKSLKQKIIELRHNQQHPKLFYKNISNKIIEYNSHSGIYRLFHKIKK